MDPLPTLLVVAALACLVTWTASAVTGDSSWVDRVWSILPAVYVWIVALWAGLADPRLDIMALIVTMWGARLTFNFARKGGYRGVEDYRWAVLRSRMSPARYRVFTVLFIVLAQNAVIFAITLPALTAYEHRATHFGAWDAVWILLFLAFLAGETIADQQQWEFQERARAAREAGTPLDPGFVTTGLWKYSRHPNLFFELAQWWAFALIGVAAGGASWTLLGALALTGLLIGSLRFTESISRSRHAAYDAYRERVSALIPWPPRRP